jgi:hypothetical protein
MFKLLIYIYNYTNFLYRDLPIINKNIIKEELESLYSSSLKHFNNKLLKHKEERGFFSLTLDAWTAFNQDAYLGITM